MKISRFSLMCQLRPIPCVPSDWPSVFASAERFVDAFDFEEPVHKVVVDVSRAHFWDITAVSALY